MQWDYKDLRLHLWNKAVVLNIKGYFGGKNCKTRVVYQHMNKRKKSVEIFYQIITWYESIETN